MLLCVSSMDTTGCRMSINTYSPSYVGPVYGSLCLEEARMVDLAQLTQYDCDFYCMAQGEAFC